MSRQNVLPRGPFDLRRRGRAEAVRSNRFLGMRSASGLLTAALLVSGTVPAVAAPATPGGYQWGENLCVSGSSRLPQAATGKAMQAIDGGRDHALWLTPEGQVLIQGAAISFSSGGQTGGACYSAPSAVAGLTGVSQV